LDERRFLGRGVVEVRWAVHRVEMILLGYWMGLVVVEVAYGRVVWELMRHLYCIHGDGSCILREVCCVQEDNADFEMIQLNLVRFYVHVQPLILPH
jgi:hypothetical protein